MGSINFIGSNNDDTDANQSPSYDFDYTDPEKDTSRSARLKPKTSFFKRHKKTTAPTDASDKSVVEAKFADKERVRKGKYKPVAVTYTKPTSSPKTVVTPSYAPVREQHQSVIQPSLSEAMEHTQSVSSNKSSSSLQPKSQPNTSQSIIAPRIAQSTGLRATDFPTPPQQSSSSTAVPAQAAAQSIPSPTPPSQLQAQPQQQPAPARGASAVMTTQPTTQVSSVSHSTSRSTATPPAITSSRLSTSKPIPVPPPPPVHAAPMPVSAGAVPTRSPAMTMTYAQPTTPGQFTPYSGQPQNLPQKMYDTASEVRSDTPIAPGITQAPVFQNNVSQNTISQNTMTTPVITPQSETNLPELAIQQPAVRQIPTPPLPPVHTPMIVSTAPAAPAAPVAKTQVTSTPALPSQPAGQPASMERTLSSRPGQPGVVHAQHVENLRGEKTNPEPITGKFLDINLLPVDFLKELSPTSKIVGLLKVALVSCTILGVFYGIMVGYQSYFILQTKNNQLEINRLENEIQSYATLQNEINATNDQLTAVNTLLSQHIYWSNVFNVLEQYTLPNVYYQSFSGNTSGVINLQAVTTDFASISRQVHIFNQESAFVESASVTTAARSNYQPEADATEEETESTTESGSSDVVAFSLNLHLNPAIFFYQTNATNNGNN